MATKGYKTVNWKLRQMDVSGKKIYVEQNKLMFRLNICIEKPEYHGTWSFTISELPVQIPLCLGRTGRIHDDIYQ
jgi:hypothetical protein